MRVLLASLLVVVSVGCGDPTSVEIASRSDGTDLAREGAAELRAASSGRRSRGIDDDFLRIESQAIGFGGLYWDAAGRAFVALSTSPDRDETVRIAVGAVLTQRTAEQGGDGTVSVRVERARYSFSELVAMQRRVARVMREIGLQFVDVDERTNKVRVGVTAESNRGHVRDRLRAHGIPGEALEIEQAVELSPTVNLRDFFRPLGGGQQIKNAGTGVCTHGFTVDAVTSGVRGFLTAGHCELNNKSLVGAGGLGVDFFQNTNQPWYKVGDVAINPIWNSGDPNCAGYSRCTAADVMFVDGSLSNSDHAKRVWGNTTLGANNAEGPLTVNTYWSGFTKGVAFIGSVVDKVGRTTGGTTGTVVGTCVDVEVPGGISPYLVLCANRVDSSAIGEGDSGAPVFFPPTVGGGSPIALGIQFAGFPTSVSFPICSTTAQPSQPVCGYYYSPLSQIELHLGTFVTP